MATGVYVSDVFLGFRKIPHFIIAVMVREKNQSWVLRATIDSDIIDNIVRGAWIGKKGDALIINRENVLQTTPRFGGKVMEPPKAPDFAAATGTTVEEMDFRGETVLYATSIIKLKKWVLVISEAPTEQLTPLLQARFLAALIGLGGVLLIVIGAYFTTRAMMKELQRMDQKQAASDEMAIQSSKMAALGKMAAGIAHEINNPLAVIGEKAGWMKDLLGMDEVAKSENFQELLDAVNKIEFHVVRAKTVTHRLLGFARRMEPMEERVNVNDILDESIDFLENDARYRNIDIQTNYAPDLPLTTTDQAQLQQVFLNIINNAIDAIGKDGEITINTRPINQTNRISIEISDTGPGIPKEVLQKIFDPFFTTKEVGKGTGPGFIHFLQHYRKVGRQDHGGQRGRQGHHVHHLFTGEMTRGGDGMEKFKMLVVDDEQDFLETILKRLKARKIEVTGVESGYKALEFLDSHDVDVTILDVKMPGMDGIETLREIKKRKPLVEVIMLTGHASVESGIQGMQLGAFDYVMKPVALDELLEKVRQAYDRKVIQEGKS